jgi:hypothetical protein
MGRTRTFEWVEHQKHVDIFSLWGHCSPGICSFRPDSERASLSQGSKSADNVRNDDGTRTGCFTMTMRRHTLLCLCRDFWLLKTRLGPPPSLLAWFGPLRFLRVSEIEIKAKRATFPGCHWNSGTVADRPTCHSKTSCSIDGRYDKCIQHFGWKTWKEDLGVNGGIILEWMLGK